MNKRAWAAAVMMLATVGAAEPVFAIPDECRPKAWWFFGQTETTHEGIAADAEAMKREYGLPK